MRPNSLPPRRRLDAVLAAGEGRLQAEEEDHLRQRQRDHGQVDALAADRQRTGDPAQRRRAQRGQRNGQLGRQPPHLGRVRRDVAGAAQEHGVAEGQQAAEAQQQVEGAGEQHAKHITFIMNTGYTPASS